MVKSGCVDSRKKFIGCLHPSIAIILTCFLSAPLAINPGCKCIRFKSTFGKEWGVFSSPDYPNAYPRGIRCDLYSFQAPKDYIVHVVLTEFNLPPPGSHGCGGGDFLKFFLHLEEDGVNELTPWNSVLCGRASNQSFFSSSRHLIIQFHSKPGRPTGNTGGSPPFSFIGHFRFLNSSQFESNGRLVPGSKCDYQFMSANYTAAEGKFFSPNYPSTYPHNIKCSYFFHASLHERVKIVFEKVALQPRQYSCLNKTDVIRILDGSGGKSPVISLICNSVKDFEILSTGPDLLVDFISNSEEPNTGFVAKFIFIKVQLDHPYDHLRIGAQSYDLSNYGLEGLTQASTLVPQCNQVITSDAGTNGSFASPNYPHPYPAKSRCRYDFIGHGKERIQIVFTDFSLYHPEISPKSCGGADDTLTPFVHSEGNLAKLEDFCGINTPLAVMSNGHKLTLELNAPQSSRTSRGFSALYYFVEDFGIKTGRQLPDFPCAFVYNSTETPNGTFASPNHPGLYPRDTECHYFFHGNDNEHVELHFTEFYLHGSYPCDEMTNSDYIEFSNYMPVDPKFKRYCGTHKDLRVESERKFFRVTFRSNSKSDGTGFLANFHFCDKPHRRQTLSSNSESIVTFYLSSTILTIGLVIIQR